MASKATKKRRTKAPPTRGFPRKGTNKASKKSNAKPNKRTAKKRAAATRRSVTRRAPKPQARKRSSAKVASRKSTPKRTRSAKRGGAKRTAGASPNREAKRIERLEKALKAERKQRYKLESDKRFLREVLREYEPKGEAEPPPGLDFLPVPKGAEVLSRDSQGRATSIAMDRYIGDEYSEIDWGDEFDWDFIEDEYEDAEEDAYAETAG